MKEKLKVFFRNPNKGNKRRIGLILTIVALVEVLAILLVSTSAWVESVSSIKIFTTAQDPNVTNGTKGIIESPINQQVNMQSTSSDTYDLSKYFRPSGGFHMASASSVDGRTMYFRAGSNSAYRIGSINDKNVNYISFTIRTTNSTNVSLAFDQVPTIALGSTTLNNSTDANKKLVRFSIGDNSGNYKVYSLFDEVFTEMVPADETVNTSGDHTVENGYKLATVYPFADYVKGKGRVCETAKDGFLSFNMWIQDPTGASKSLYDGKALTVSNLKLVIVTPFYVKVAKKNGNTYEVDPDGYSGTVAVEDGEYSKEVVYYAVPGQTVNLHALASETNGYDFIGWSTHANLTSTSTTVGSTGLLSNSADYLYMVPTDATETNNKNKVYAKFSDEHDLYMKPVFTHKGNVSNCKYAAFVFGPDPSTGAIVGKWYVMSASGAYYKCTYKGSATSVIFCYLNPNFNYTDSMLNNATNAFDSYRWLQTYDLSVPARAGTYRYVVTCRQIIGKTRNTGTYDADNDFGTNKLLGYWEHNYVEVNVAYTTNSAYSDTLQESGGTIYCALTDTVKDQTSGANYYAWWYKDAYYVKMDGKEYQDYDSNYQPISQYHYDKKVTLSAKNVAMYNFDGWYEDAAGTGTKLSSAQDYEITAPDNGIYSGTDNVVTKTYYARYVEKPASWSLKYGTSGASTWSTLTLNQSSDHVFVGTMSLTYGQEFNFKIYDDKKEQWYTNQVSYTDIVTDTILNAGTLRNDLNGDMYLKAARQGTYTFTFNDSTKKLTISTSATKPTVSIWNSSTDGGTGNTKTMTAPGLDSNVYTYTWTGITEGQDIYFKINDQSRNEWYTNGTYYNGYTTKSLVSNGQLTTSGNNMHIKAHAGTYKFSFNYSTKKLSIEVTSWTSITITLDSTQVSSWIGDSSAKIYYISENDQDGLHWELMTASNSNKTYTVSVPSNYANNTQFLRRNSNNDTTWNYWPASTTYRGFNKKFTISSSDGNNHSGTWSAS